MTVWSFTHLRKSSIKKVTESHSYHYKLQKRREKLASMKVTVAK